MKRRDLEKALGRGINPEVWDRLEEDGYVLDAEHADDIGRLRTKAIELERYLGLHEPAASVLPRSRAGRSQERSVALSDIYAIVARERTDVAYFRATTLAGGLLAHDRVGRWIAERSGGAIDRTAKSVPTVAWADPGDNWQRVAVAGSDELKQLAKLTDSLAGYFGWSRAQATLFVLCDLVPYVAPVQTRFEQRAPLMARSRFIITVDPAVTPRELAERYSRVRLATLDGRPKKLGPKALELAVFGIENKATEGLALLRAWNRHVRRRYPDRVSDDAKWIYAESNLDNFVRDVRTAIHRLTEPSWAVGHL